MLTQGEDVEAHALTSAGMVDLGHRPSPRPGPQDGPRLPQRRSPARRAGRRRRRIRWSGSSPIMRARFADDPHLWATALFDEVVALGYDRSYPTFVRQLRQRGLRPHCEACRGREGPGHDRDRASARARRSSGTGSNDAGPRGAAPPTSCWARCRIRAGPGACSPSRSTRPHLIEAMDAVMRRLGGTARMLAHRPAGDGDRAGQPRRAAIVRAGGQALRRRRRAVPTAAREPQGRGRVGGALRVRAVVADDDRDHTEEAQVVAGPVPRRTRRRPDAPDPAPTSEAELSAALRADIHSRPGMRVRATVGELADAEPLLALPALAFPATIEVDPHRCGERDGGVPGEPLLGPARPHRQRADAAPPARQRHRRDPLTRRDAARRAPPGAGRGGGDRAHRRAPRRAGDRRAVGVHHGPAL